MENKHPNLYLSKSLFIRGLQCHKSLYLDRYYPELRDEIPESVYAQFQSGMEVGKLARQLFPGGVEISYEDLSPQEQVEKTQQEIANGTVTLYEAAFSYDNVFVKVDVLYKGHEGWEIYEVKKSTEIKDENFHREDVAVQFYVLTGTGLSVSKSFLVHINEQYVRNGDIEVDKLFITEDITDSVKEKQSFVVDEIRRMREMLKGDIPVIDIGTQCEKPYECNFQGHCFQHIPKEGSVFELKGIKHPKSVNPYYLYRKGIIYFKDIPLDILPDKQKIQVEMDISKGVRLNKDSIKKFLDSLCYPIYFLDFETIYKIPIPLFDGTRPNQWVPFQYSLHYIEKENAPLKHLEYLAPAGIDPQNQLIEKLVSEIPENACVVVYNQSFEGTVLRDSKAWVPEYSEKIDCIIKNIRDIMTPFSNRDYYHWEMKGSYSLKSILPVLSPGMSYDDMEISNGEDACQSYLTMLYSQDQQEIDRIRTALLKYCKLDTFGMVKLWEKLKELVKKED